MILSIAVIVGFLAGLVRAWYTKRTLKPPDLRLSWVVMLAFVLQWFAFHLTLTRQLIPDGLAAAILVISQALLLIFVWRNLHHAGLWALALGLVLNLIVIVSNGGLMPISPEMTSRIYPNVSPEYWQVGERLGTGKDIVLPVADTRLWQLSDRFFVPFGGAYRVAYSLGDVFIAFGAFWLLWQLGAGEKSRSTFLSQEVSPS